jgi:hypothetical protein
MRFKLFRMCYKQISNCSICHQIPIVCPLLFLHKSSSLRKEIKTKTIQKEEHIIKIESKINSNQIKSDQIKSNQQTKPNRIKSNRIISIELFPFPQKKKKKKKKGKTCPFASAKMTLPSTVSTEEMLLHDFANSSLHKSTRPFFCF